MYVGDPSVNMWAFFNISTRSDIVFTVTRTAATGEVVVTLADAGGENPQTVSYQGTVGSLDFSSSEGITIGAANGFNGEYAGAKLAWLKWGTTTNPNAYVDFRFENNLTDSSAHNLTTTFAGTVIYADTPFAAPRINAGADQAINAVPGTGTLTATITANDAIISARAWSLVDKPVGAPTPMLSTPTADSTAFSGVTTAGLYIFRFTITYNGGQMLSDDVIVEAVGAPVARLTSSYTGSVTTSYTGYEREVIKFYGNQSENAARVEWTFGDGNRRGHVTEMVHAYRSPGTYPLTLTVWNKFGDSASASATVTVSSIPVTNTINCNTTQCLQNAVNALNSTSGGTEIVLDHTVTYTEVQLIFPARTWTGYVTVRSDGALPDIRTRIAQDSNQSTLR